MIGGAVGVNYGEVKQTGCSADMKCSLSLDNGGGIYSRLGGFAGRNYGTILNSYSEGNMTVSSSACDTL